MMEEHMSLRNFKGGSWDLRKDERRKQAQNIGFPDRRRAIDRRKTAQAEDRAAGDILQWVTKSSLDE
ncbi:MAG TPA: hypothetical protein VJ385_18475 [Fibrobacteria bacterium]|nr:hypothetical protein [Fibrobacteria bacterium]